MPNFNFVIFTITFVGLTLPDASAKDANRLDTARVASLTGLKGKWNPDEGVYKVTQSREDVSVKVDGQSMPPFMGLTSWAAFQAGMKSEAMVMGDLVLFQDEVNPVMDALFANGLEVTALHNHFFYDDPKVYFMHIGGEDSLARLAGGVRKALDQVGAIRKSAPLPRAGFGGSALPTKSSIGLEPLEKTLGHKGEAKNGMAKFVIGRTAKMPCGCPAGKEMGVNSWAAFMGSEDNAVVDGDFAVLEEELQGVLRALRKSAIRIVAIHHHMVGESPRFLFLHYWGQGKAQELAKGVKSALATQKK